MAMDEINDGASQNVHIEGFHDVGVGTHLETFQLVLITALGSEQDDGDVVGSGIALDFLTHGGAVHLGHHDI